MQKLRKLLPMGLTAIGLCLSVLAFTSNLLGVQQVACSFSALQPEISDFCGEFGLGGTPTRAERIAWQKRIPGSCPSLEEHIRAFPKGAFREQAGALLAVRRTVDSSEFVDVSQESVAYVRQGVRPFSSRSTAVSDALARARLEAANGQCASLFPGEAILRFSVTALEEDCVSRSDKFYCGLNYRVACTVQRQRTQEVCG